MRTAVVWFYRLLGAGSLANGAWMLLAPMGWFSGLPAGVTDTGPLNVHFVLDLGVVFLIAGAAALYCAAHPDTKTPAYWGLTLFYAGHALVHVYEIVAGRLPGSHWAIDAPLVFAPAVALIGIGLIDVSGRRAK
jgi:hypothetical protein